MSNGRYNVFPEDKGTVMENVAEDTMDYKGEVPVLMSDDTIKQMEELVREKALKFTETTPDYSRISGEDIQDDATVPEKIANIVALMLSIDPEEFELDRLLYFEDSFVGLYVKKLHLMIGKQKDYGPDNITKAGERGIATRAQDKLERLKQLLGDPDQQVKEVRKLVKESYNAETEFELEDYLRRIEEVVAPASAANEPVVDSWIDLSNYGDIGTTVHENAWPRPLRS